MLILSLSFHFPLLFFRLLCLYFILVHSFFLLPCSWLFSLFLFLFFLADLVSLFSPSLLSVDVCFACVYFSIMNFPWVPFSFAFFRHLLFYLGLQPFVHWCQHWLLILDFAGERRVEGVGRQLFRGREKGYWGVEVVSCCAIHILQTYFSVPGQKSDTFSHRSSGFLDLPWLPSLSLPSLFFCPIAVELSFPLSNFLLSCFLCNMFYLLLLFSSISLMRNTHLEGELFWKRGRSLLIIAIG